MKILTILGARPQFIKAGTISREIKKRQKRGEKIQEIIVHTGQHYDKSMSDIFFEELHLPKLDYYLGVGGKSQGVMTGEMIVKLEEVMQQEKTRYSFGIRRYKLHSRRSNCSKQTPYPNSPCRSRAEKL